MTRIIIAVMLGLTIAACGGSDTPAEPAPEADAPESAVEATSEPESAVEVEPTDEPEPTEEPAEEWATLAKFEAIESGMTIDEAVAIMGSEGEVLSETDLAGIHSEMRVWYGRDRISNMNIMFQNGQVLSKAQLGLK